MERRYISGLQAGDMVDDIFYVNSKKLINYKSKSGCFLILTLSDKTGSMPAKFWDFDPAAHDIADKTFIKCQGEVVEYDNNLEIQIQAYELVDKACVDPREFLPVTPCDIAEMQKEIAALALAMHNPFLSRLLSRFCQDKELFPKFSAAPAAKMVHQAYLGGLLEHSLKTAKIVSVIADYYPAVNKDLAVTGALLHDIGKLGEYDFDYSIEVTDEGRLLGHIVLGLELLDGLIKQVPDFPSELRIALRHIITSHHGRYEWQSPRRPKTIEACLVHYADAVEADMWKFSSLIERHRGEGWSPFERSLERYVYVNYETEGQVGYREDD